MNKYICQKCNKEYPEYKFYNHKDGKRDLLCKKCRTKGINDLTPSTFLHIMEYFDIPFIKRDWYQLVGRSLKKATETGKYVDGGHDYPITIFGKYLSKMKLMSFKNFGYKDSDMLNKYNNYYKEEEEGYSFFYNNDGQWYNIIESRK